MFVKTVRAATLAALLASTAAFPAFAQAPAQQPAPAAGQAKAEENPVVARVNGQEIRRAEVMAAMQALDPRVQQLPMQVVYPALLEQVVNARLVTAAGYKDKLEASADVKARMKAAEERFVQEAWLKKSIDAKITDAMVKKKYETWLKENPPQDEVRARHILVAKKEEAQEILKKLQGGAKFEELAKAQTIDTTAAQNGGDLGYFTADQMVEPFAKAAFAMKAGEVSKEPVETQFGWHVIKVEDKRKQTPPTFEQAAPELRGMVAQDIAGEAIEALRKTAKIETFNIDGTPMPKPEAAPAAGAQKPAEKKP